MRNFMIHVHFVHVIWNSNILHVLGKEWNKISIILLLKHRFTYFKEKLYDNLKFKKSYMYLRSNEIRDLARILRPLVTFVEQTFFLLIMDCYKHFSTIFWKFKWRIGYGKYSSLLKINRQWRKWRALATFYVNHWQKYL